MIYIKRSWKETLRERGIHPSVNLTEYADGDYYILSEDRKSALQEEFPKMRMTEDVSISIHYDERGETRQEFKESNPILIDGRLVIKEVNYKDTIKEVPTKLYYISRKYRKQAEKLFDEKCIVQMFEDADADFYRLTEEQSKKLREENIEFIEDTPIKIKTRCEEKSSQCTLPEISICEEEEDCSPCTIPEISASDEEEETRVFLQQISDAFNATCSLK